MPAGYKQDIGKLTNRLTANQLVEVLDIKRRRFGDKYAVQGYLYLETIRRYAQSADNDIGPQHVPTRGAPGHPEEITQEVSSFAIEGAHHVWSRMLSERDPYPWKSCTSLRSRWRLRPLATA